MCERIKVTHLFGSGPYMAGFNMRPYSICIVIVFISAVGELRGNVNFLLNDNIVSHSCHFDNVNNFKYYFSFLSTHFRYGGAIMNVIKFLQILFEENR